jgi:orotidine-5'-phosphate decarboxylase
MKGEPRVIVALDYAGAAAALALADRLHPSQCRLKIGKELFTAAGPALVETLATRGFPVFLDLKYHDIPTTVANACRAAATLGVWMLNVHALGGSAMMNAAREAVSFLTPRPKLVAVTLLTSMGDAELDEVGVAGGAPGAVVRLARLAQASGLDGVVASAQEAALLRRECGAGFSIVTPGIRPADAVRDDQQRVATPRAAIASGANYLVIGRPITRAPDPLAALQAINREVEEALKDEGGRMKAEG